MEIVINIIATFGIIIYVLNKSEKTEKMLIREITKAVMAKDIVEYAEAIPEEETEEEIEEDKDELVDVDSVDEKLLIRQLNKEYENK